RILAAGNDGQGKEKNPIVIWDVNAAKELGRLQPLHNRFLKVSLSADGKLLASCGSNFDGDDRSGFIQLWDTATSKELRRLDVQEIRRFGIVNIALSPDGKLLAIGDAGAAIRLLETETGKQVRQFAARNRTGALLSFSRDGKRLAAATRDGAVQVWDVAARKRLLQGEGPPCRCFGLAFTGESEVLA